MTFHSHGAEPSAFSREDFGCQFDRANGAELRKELPHIVLGGLGWQVVNVHGFHRCLLAVARHAAKRGHCDAMLRKINALPLPASRRLHGPMGVKSVVEGTPPARGFGCEHGVQRRNGQSG
jgi:hypothetical protein